MSQTPVDGGSGDGGLDRCLSFTVRGPWAHFRRIEGNIVKQTYRIIPRTTVAGLVAAIAGLDRDGYYHFFGQDVSAIAIEPRRPLRTINMPMNTLTTSVEGMTRLNSRGNLTIGLPDPTYPRQQHNYEVLVDPSYRIDLWVADDEFYRMVRSRLEAGESYYVPSLGLSEHLADIEYHGEFAIEGRPDDDRVKVDSIVPEAVDSIVVEEGMTYRLERSPAFMEADESGRTTTGFRSYAFSPRADPLPVDDVSTHVVDGRTVMFT